MIYMERKVVSDLIVTFEIITCDTLLIESKWSLKFWIHDLRGEVPKTGFLRTWEPTPFKSCI